MRDPDPYPRLRYRRFGGGYRRDEVLFHLRELEATVRGLEAQLASSRERNDELARELAAANADLVALRAREREIDEAVAEAHRRSGAIVETAETRAQALLAQAEEHAARIRGEAHLKVDDIGKQLEEILRLRESMVAMLKGAVHDVGVAVGRIERGEPVLGAAAQQPQGGHAPPSGREPEPGDDAVFASRVELDAGPFGDYATLSAFERSLAALPNVEDVYVRRYVGERAAIELTMAYDQPLLQLLRTSLPFEFDAEWTEAEELRITIRASALAGSG